MSSLLLSEPSLTEPLRGLLPTISWGVPPLKEAIEKADVLIEALQWIRAFRDKVTVVKIGGRVIDAQGAPVGDGRRMGIHHLGQESVQRWSGHPQVELLVELGGNVEHLLHPLALQRRDEEHRGVGREVEGPAQQGQSPDDDGHAAGKPGAAAQAGDEEDVDR